MPPTVILVFDEGEKNINTIICRVMNVKVNNGLIGNSSALSNQK